MAWELTRKDDQGTEIVGVYETPDDARNEAIIGNKEAPSGVKYGWREAT